VESVRVSTGEPVNGSANGYVALLAEFAHQTIWPALAAVPTTITLRSIDYCSNFPASIHHGDLIGLGEIHLVKIARIVRGIALSRSRPASVRFHFFSRFPSNPYY
jgi:hypothetical protein